MTQLQVSVLGRDDEGNVVSDSVTVEVVDAGPAAPAGPDVPAEPAAPGDAGGAPPALPGDIAGAPSFPPSDVAPGGGQPAPGGGQPAPGDPAGELPPPPPPTPPTMTDLQIGEMSNPTGQQGVDGSFVPPGASQADRSQTLFNSTGGFR